MPLPARVSAAVVSHIFYLHGFASSPASSKATFFSERFAAHGLRIVSGESVQKVGGKLVHGKVPR